MLCCGDYFNLASCSLRELDSAYLYGERAGLCSLCAGSARQRDDLSAARHAAQLGHGQHGSAQEVICKHNNSLWSPHQLNLERFLMRNNGQKTKIGFFAEDQTRIFFFFCAFPFFGGGERTNFDKIWSEWNVLWHIRDHYQFRPIVTVENSLWNVSVSKGRGITHRTAACWMWPWPQFTELEVQTKGTKTFREGILLQRLSRHTVRYTQVPQKLHHCTKSRTRLSRTKPYRVTTTRLLQSVGQRLHTHERAGFNTLSFLLVSCMCGTHNSVIEKQFQITKCFSTFAFATWKRMVGNCRHLWTGKNSFDLDTISLFAGTKPLSSVIVFSETNEAWKKLITQNGQLDKPKTRKKKKTNKKPVNEFDAVL